jgi:peptide deformylase
MPIKIVLLYPKDEAALRQTSEEIKRFDKTTKRLIQDLKDTLLSQPGAGLAAAQIGVHKRVVVVRFGQDTGEMQAPLALVNPVILEEGALAKGFDGCLSLPRIVTWDTSRPTWLHFEALNEQGERFEMRVEGIDSILVHHEIDHLNGVLFLDRLEDKNELYMSVKDGDKEKLIRLDKLRA